MAQWTIAAVSVIHLSAKSFLILAWKLFYPHPIQNNQNLEAKTLENPGSYEIEFKTVMETISS